MALMAILFTPLLVQNKRNDVTSMSPSTSSQSKPFTQSSTNRDIIPNSISSQVIQIEAPLMNEQIRDPASIDQTYNLTLESRQLRFEWNKNEVLQKDWQLQRISRAEKNGKLREIALLKDDEGLALGSVYVELESFEDEFRVFFKNAKTQESRELKYFVKATRR